MTDTPMPDAEIEQTIAILIGAHKLLRSLSRSREHRDPAVTDTQQRIFAKALVEKLKQSGVRFYRKPAPPPPPGPNWALAPPSHRPPGK